jgi:hypothetical protein
MAASHKMFYTNLSKKKCKQFENFNLWKPTMISHFSFITVSFFNRAQRQNTFYIWRCPFENEHRFGSTFSDHDQTFFEFF